VTPEQEAAAIIGGDLRYGSWATDPAAVVSTITSRAAEVVGRATISAQRSANYESAHLTKVACLLVAEADNPSIPRGAVLDALAARFNVE
jgi:hypothetical protein